MIYEWVSACIFNFYVLQLYKLHVPICLFLPTQDMQTRLCKWNGKRGTKWTSKYWREIRIRCTENMVVCWHWTSHDGWWICLTDHRGNDFHSFMDVVVRSRGITNFIHVQCTYYYYRCIEAWRPSSINHINLKRFTYRLKSLPFKLMRILSYTIYTVLSGASIW